MRCSRQALVRTAAVACALLALGASPVASASGDARRVCAAGEIRWLERWDRAYAGRLLRPATIYRSPGGAPFLRLGVTDPYGFWMTLPIVAQRVDRRCRPTWFRVRVRHYPNGTLGWIRAGTMATSRIHKRIVIDLSRKRLILYHRGRPVLSTPAAVGKTSTPTPRGRFYITQRYVMRDPGGPFGSRALGISAFSDVLRSWKDGGPIGIHGTNEPFSIGRPVSHGCVRLPERAIRAVFAKVPLATPVLIRR